MVTFKILRLFLRGGGGCFHKDGPIYRREGLITGIKYLFTNRWAFNRGRLRCRFARNLTFADLMQNVENYILINISISKTKDHVQGLDLNSLLFLS